ncbi:MAG TPA: hypothetical protein VKR22_15450, partial [Acidimicrobiales bacterium]|nr:hypothetical protein [Acidimicrobiales bacterium]
MWNTVLAMPPPAPVPSTPPLTDTLARRALERAVADKQAGMAEEMQRIVESTFELVERTGDVDP